MINGDEAQAIEVINLSQLVGQLELISSIALAQRIRLRLYECPLETASGPVAVTASLGVAVSSPEDDATSTALIRAADLALYRAKRAGRNRAELCTAEESILAPWPASADVAIEENH